MDRQPPPHDYGAYPQQQQQRPPPAANMQQQQQQFGFANQHQQQFPPPPFMPPHPSSMQQFPYPPPPQHLPHQQVPPPQLHPHPPPHLLHQQQQQQQQQQQPPPHPYPPHYPPHLLPSPFHSPYDAAQPPPVPPPSDPELQKRIDKLVEYAVKNGPEFEAMIREKQQGNPEYSFLFGGDGHNYYRYKLWLSTRSPGGPFNSPFPPSSLPMMHPSSNPMMNPVPQMHQTPFPPFYDPQQLHHQRPLPFGAHGRPDFDQSSKPFKVTSGILPPDVAMELGNMLNTLNGTKESIKSAKMWFMQRSQFAPALAEALRDRIFAVDDSERQLHVIYLANDILFDSLQRRINLHDLDNEALAFKPVIGSMLARVYHNPQNKDDNQSRLQKILQFWASKEVYDQDAINTLEAEMIGGPATSFPGPPTASADSMAGPGFPLHASQWQPDRQGTMAAQDPSDKQVPQLAKQQFVPNSVPVASFAGSLPINSAVQPTNQQPPTHMLQTPSTSTGEKLPPYPLFPPGLIPGMVRKMQIGSGVPYSPLSPLDIPTMIPPSDVSQSEILQRVSKFFKEIGEVNPSEGPMNSKDEDDEYERDSPVRKGGACIPPPPNLQVDQETGAYDDGSVERKPGSSGRLGLGATADPNEISQYDDVYTSYRKQRSTNYHSSMSARAGAR